MGGSAGTGASGGTSGTGGVSGVLCGSTTCTPTQLCCGVGNGTYHCSDGFTGGGTEADILCDNPSQCGGGGLKCCGTVGIHGELVDASCDIAPCPTNDNRTLCGSSADCGGSPCCKTSASYPWRYCNQPSGVDCN